MDHDVNLTQVSSDILCEFLETAIHCILYVRELYPSGTFERQKKYNVPVQIVIHPEVKEYIWNTVNSLRPLLEKEEVEQLVVVILNEENEPVERFIFELGQQLKTNNVKIGDTDLVLLEQSLRSLVLKLSISEALLESNPKNCTWAVQVHTKASEALELEQKQIEDFPWVLADDKQTKITHSRIIPLKTMDTPLIKVQMLAEESTTKT